MGQRPLAFYRDQLGLAYVSHQVFQGKAGPVSLHFLAAKREDRPVEVRS